VFVENKLFATLDTTVRKVAGQKTRLFTSLDTVDHSKIAKRNWLILLKVHLMRFVLDLLLHVVDISIQNLKIIQTKLGH
jgi:50S ribosomal subunit-associated GTPase HflX